MATLDMLFSHRLITIALAILTVYWGLFIMLSADVGLRAEGRRFMAYKARYAKPGRHSARPTSHRWDGKSERNVRWLTWDDTMVSHKGETRFNSWGTAAGGVFVA